MDQAHTPRQTDPEPANQQHDASVINLDAHRPRSAGLWYGPEDIAAEIADELSPAARDAARTAPAVPRQARPPAVEEHAAARPGRAFDTPELPEDPAGDAPWWPAWLRSRTALRARIRYLTRRMRRRLRRWAARQRTRHGVLPRAGYGALYILEWIYGPEGQYTRALEHRARTAARDARAEARRARFAFTDRAGARRDAEQHLDSARTALREYRAARTAARHVRVRRTVIVLLPVGALESAGYLRAGRVGLATATAALVTLVAQLGRRVDASRTVEQPAPAVVRPLDPGMTPAVFGRMLRAALTEDLGLAVASLEVVGHRWGYEATGILHKARPAQISERIEDLEASLIARPGSLLLQQSPHARPAFALRALTSDPWAGQEPLAYRAPRSASVHRHAELGIRLDRAPLLLPLLRTNTAIVGAPGAGKSTALLAIADYLTACADAVVWDLDLGSAGAGLDPLGPAISRRATNKRAAQTMLGDALAIAMARPALLRPLGMGRDWQPTARYPALYLLIDEFAALVAAGLWELAAQILRIDRKSAVGLVLASNGATKTFTGSVDPVSVPVRIAMACRPSDVTQLFGAGALGDGWAAHRLRPAEGQVLNDAAVAYIRSGELAVPVPYRFGYLSDEQAELRARERQTAGLPQLDQESLTLAQVDLARPLPAGIDRLPVTAADADQLSEAAATAQLPILLQAAIEAMRESGATAMPTGELLAAIQARDESDRFAAVSAVGLGRDLSSLGAGSRSHGRGRAVYLADLLAAAGRQRTASAA